MTRLCKFILLTLMVLNIRVSCNAHDNNIVHPFTLTGKAWKFLRENPDFGENYKEMGDYFYRNDEQPAGYDLGGGNYDKSKIERKGTLGTIEEDEPLDRTVNHFYNPLQPTRQFSYPGLGTGGPATTYGKTLWQENRDVLHYSYIIHK